MCAPGCKKFPSVSEISQPWRPPAGGYRIKSVPPELLELGSDRDFQAGWERFGSKDPSHQDVALHEMLQFLKQQGFRGAEWTEAVKQEQGNQYCAADPRFCPKEERPMALKGSKRNNKRVPTSETVVAWSRNVWQLANYALSDGVTDPISRVAFIKGVLSEMISSPKIGCPQCAKHWRKNLAAYPTEGIRTLQDAREWLVAVHNAASPHTPDMSLEAVAAQFGWTLEGQNIESIPGPVTVAEATGRAA